MNHYSSNAPLFDIDRPNTTRDLPEPKAEPRREPRPERRLVSHAERAAAEVGYAARLLLLRALLPATTAEIRARHPDLWSGDKDSAGYRRLLRNLRAAGAVPVVDGQRGEGGEWKLGEAPWTAPSGNGRQVPPSTTPNAVRWRKRAAAGRGTT